MKRHGLRDDQFARIENLLPGRPGTVGREKPMAHGINHQKPVTTAMSALAQILILARSPTVQSSI
jgi:hypothetical protein